MIMNDIAMIAADTSRSRVYLQSLVRNRLIPNFVLIFDPHESKNLPGQIGSDKYEIKSTEKNSGCWSEINNELSMPIINTLEKASIEFKLIKADNINNEELLKNIKNRIESTFIYSGFGGNILRKKAFETGKKFLHVHGGYLPHYKGSTANYYSLLIDNDFGASSIFLDDNIDSGPILMRKKFKPPADRQSIDHVYDNSARAKVLIETLKLLKKNENYNFIPNSKNGETYYIIHPVLKHIAILAKS